MAHKRKDTKTAAPKLMDQAVIEIPALFSNRFQVTVMGEITRIAFGEVYPQLQEKFHTAVIISTGALDIFTQLLLDTVKTNKENIAATLKSAEEAEESANG